MSEKNPTRLFLITPSDATDMVPVATSIRCDSAGVIRFIPVDNGSTEIEMNVQAGEILPYQIKRVKDTGTTVAVIHGAAG